MKGYDHAERTLVTELTAAAIEGASDAKITAFVSLLQTITANGLYAKTIRRLARLSITQA